MIDLHTHTTASDGRCTPAELVTRAIACGVTVLAVTDHDTVAGWAPAAEASATTDLDLVSGIEITAVVDGKDVHVLGYFIDVDSLALEAFLAAQRQRRIDRVHTIVDRLAALGIQLDVEAILEPVRANPTTSVGRPWIARALVAGGHVPSVKEAFERWLAHGRPAFVPRMAAAPEEVFARIHEAGGIASLAHPGPVGHDEWIPCFVAAGLDALEAYHSDHDERTTREYLQLARRLGLAVSGGSDYHGDQSHGAGGPGSVALPLEEYERLMARRSRAINGSG